MDFPLHSLIANSNSEFFDAITSLKDNAQEMLRGDEEIIRDERRIVHVDIPADVFPLIREHMYTSTCNIDTDQLADLMCGAHLLGMKKLFNETMNWILTDPLHPEAVNLCNQFGTSIPSEIGTSIPSEITTYIADYCAWWEQRVASWNLEAERRRQKKRLEMDPVAREALAALSSSESDDEGN
jgi:hypothetical protein